MLVTLYAVYIVPEASSWHHEKSSPGGASGRGPGQSGQTHSEKWLRETKGGCES